MVTASTRTIASVSSDGGSRGRGRRRQLLAARQPPRPPPTAHRLLFDPAVHRRRHLVADPRARFLPRPSPRPPNHRRAAAPRGGAPVRVCMPETGQDPSGMPRRHPASNGAATERPMKFAVIAPVAAGITADAAWMAAFAQHVEACGFESIVVVEHTVLMARYDSVYPYDESGRVELAADCPVPDPLELLAFLAGQTEVWAWPRACWCCPTTTPSCWPSGRPPWMRCRAAGCGWRGRGLAEGGDRGVRRRVRQPGPPRRRTDRGHARAVGRPAGGGELSRRVLRLRPRHVLSQADRRFTTADPHRWTQPGGGPAGGPARRRIPAAGRRRARPGGVDLANARRGNASSAAIPMRWSCRSDIW